MKVLFYTSRHGYGHLTRMAAVMQELQRFCPSVELHVRAHAPAWLLGSVKADVASSEIALDAGMVEASTTEPAIEATLERYAEIVRDATTMVTRESRVVEQLGIDVIVSDIPPLASDIAAHTSRPSIAIGNFSWDFIYAPYVAEHPEYAHIVDSIRESYGRTTLLLRLPLGHAMTAFPRQRAIPLIARAPQGSPDDARRALEIDPRDSRPVVLVAMRPASDLAPTLAELSGSGEFRVLRFDDGTPAPPDVRTLEPAWQRRFVDVLAASDVLISKLGYSTAAECIRTRTRLLYPPRRAYAEHQLLAAGLRGQAPSRGISPQDLARGRVVEPLRELLAQPDAWSTEPCDGAVHAARAILEAGA